MSGAEGPRGPLANLADLEEKIETLELYEKTILDSLNAGGYNAYERTTNQREVAKVQQRVAELKLRLLQETDAARPSRSTRTRRGASSSIEDMEKKARLTALFGKKLVDSAADGKLHQVRKILEHSARQVDLDHVSEDGDTALQAACRNGHDGGRHLPALPSRARGRTRRFGLQTRALRYVTPSPSAATTIRGSPCGW